MPVKLSLIIPCYNEEATLRAIVERVLKLRSETLALELVIVDDCSRDRSYAIARELQAEYPEIKLARHEVNQGKGAALRTGFLEATGDYVGIQDADMEYCPEDYRIMLEPLLAGKADVVFGSRYLRPGMRRVMYFWHTWMNRVLTRCSNMFTNLDLTDMETCYKLFRREAIQAIAPRLRENRFGFEPEITSYVAEDRLRVYECAVQYNPRSYEEGKKIGWRDGLRALYCILHYGACNAPVPMQLLLYFLVGGTAALTNLLSFWLLRCHTELPLWGSAAGAFAIAALVNYLLCIQLVFRHKARWNSAGEVLVYLAVLAVMLGVDCAITVGLVRMGLSPLGSKCIASVAGFFGNYVLRRIVVFPMPRAGQKH